MELLLLWSRGIRYLYCFQCIVSVRANSSSLKSIARYSHNSLAAFTIDCSSSNLPITIDTSFVLLLMTILAVIRLSLSKCLELPCIIYTQTHPAFWGYQTFICSYFVHYF